MPTGLVARDDGLREGDEVFDALPVRLVRSNPQFQVSPGRLFFRGWDVGGPMRLALDCVLPRRVSRQIPDGAPSVSVGGSFGDDLAAAALAGRHARDVATLNRGE